MIHVIKLCALIYILISCGHQDGISVSDTQTSIFPLTFALNTACWFMLAAGSGTRWICGAIHVQLLYLWVAASKKNDVSLDFCITKLKDQVMENKQ